MTYIIIKGDKGGYTAPRRAPQLDKEQVLSRKIEQGTIHDRDISDIQDHGSLGLKMKLEEKVNRGLKQREHLQRIHGSIVDGKDDKGRLYKDITLDHKKMGL